LSQVTEDDIESFYSHKSKPVILAAKSAHKQMLRKQRAPWYKLLNDDSDESEGETYDEEADELSNNIRNLNFNYDTDNYYVSSGGKFKPSGGSFLGFSESSTLQLHKGITRKERNQLKTNYLRKNIAKMMNLNPSQSKIWNDELFDNEQNNITLNLLESANKKKPNI
jgi:uncharacterized protein YyaL (SSP411 family)